MSTGKKYLKTTSARNGLNRLTTSSLKPRLQDKENERRTDLH